jgi:hypothetical protein
MAVTPISAGVGTGPVTQEVWATFLIEQINAEGGDVPLTQNNVDNIVLWMTSEEPASNWYDRNNPLNASLGTTSSDGTASYANLTAAASYTAKMINQSNMSPILNALNANASTASFRAAVVASPWASGHYDNGSSFAMTLPGAVGVGTVATTLPADPGAAVPANPAPGALGAVAGLATGGTSTNGLLSGLSGLETGVDTVLTDITSAAFWERIGLFGLGVAFIIGGIVLFVSTTKTGQTVESDAAVAAVA